jgi:transposase-like protein
MLRMTTTTTSQVSFRIRADIAENIAALAERHGVVTASQLIEKLLKEALLAEGLLVTDPDDPNAALDELLDHVKIRLTVRREARDTNRRAIFEVFEDIRTTGTLRTLRERAIVPPAGSSLSPEARQQYVHQRIARFVKTFLGMESVKEIAVPRNSPALIKSYTELR